MNRPGNLNKNLHRNLHGKMAAEFVGTFAVVFIGCGALAVLDRYPTVQGSLSVAGVFGLTVAVMIYAVGHISGAHFNPAVTLAFAAARRFPRQRVLGYWAAQIAGALLGSLFHKILLPEGAIFGAAIPHVPSGLAVAWETVLTFVLMFVIIAVATDERAPSSFAGAAIGATVALTSMVGGPVSGAAMNPARALAPALFEGRTEFLGIYLTGPFIGAVLGALCYEWIRKTTND